MKKHCTVTGFLILTILLTACQGPAGNLEEEIARLENKVKPPYQLAQVNELVLAYQHYVSTYPDREDKNAEMLRKGAQFLTEVDQAPRAVAMLQIAIKDYSGAKNTLDNILMLGELYREQLDNENVAAIIYQSAAKKYPAEGRISERIGPGWPAALDRLDSLKKNVVDTTGRQINYSKINDYINGCAVYAMILPEAEKSPDLLFQAGQLAHQTQTYNKALELFDWLHLEYPDHEKAADALFLSGYILDSELKRFDEAKIKYEDFLKKYPDNEFAETTQFLLDNLGVPAEEIIKRFEESQEEVQ